jgi:quinol-cytochrome oxidoreductase complex cytochrome b subunit
MKAIMLRAWQYLRDLTFIDPNDRAALRDFYHVGRNFIAAGMMIGLAIGMLAGESLAGRIISGVLIVGTALFMIKGWLKGY